MSLTLDEIREQGLDALRRRLVRAGMIWFLQQFSDGKGNYAKERRAWVERHDVPAKSQATASNSSTWPGKPSP